MLAGLKRILTSPLIGLIATAVAFTLAVALGLAAADREAERAAYEARIASLSRAANEAQATLTAELVSCRADRTLQAPQPDVVARAETPAEARRLLERQPEGIDACARMESADRAVLSNLKK